MDGLEKGAGRCICWYKNPGRTEDVGGRTKIRVYLQVYTNVGKKNRLSLVERGEGNIAGPIIQSPTDVRLRPNTCGVESNDISEPASCYAEIQIYKRGYYIRRNDASLLSELQPKHSKFINWNTRENLTHRISHSERSLCPCN